MSLRGPVRGFIAELRRRKVAGVAVGYVIVAWGVIQVSSTVLQMLAAPLWIGKLILGALALGSRRGLAGAGLYLVLGSAGVPWFAAAGTWTVGYIVGFVVAAGIVGALAARGWDRSPLRVVAAMVLGNLVIYAFGVPVLYVLYPEGPASLWTVVYNGAVVFVLGDLAKILLATALVPGTWALVRRAEGQDGG